MSKNLLAHRIPNKTSGIKNRNPVNWARME